jgi:hypothetical protein
MAKKALLIGINYLDSPTNALNGCINDVINMRNMLIDAYGYDSTNINVLREDTDNKPTRANIIASLTSIVAQSSKLKELWIQYSGHGSQIADTNRDETDNLDEIIVPLDYEETGVITDDMIFNIVKNSKCPTILIFDSCNSGTVCDLMWNFNATSPTQVNAVKTNNTLIQNPNIFCFSGCKDTQTSAEIFNYDTKQSCGAISNAFAECLRFNKHNVDVKKLYLDVVAYIMRQGLTQIPQMSTSSQRPNYRICRTTIKEANNSYVSSSSLLRTTMKNILRP